MSHYDYEVSKHIAGHRYPFHALVMALIQRADPEHIDKIRRMWPEIVAEFEQRYNAPGGILPNERIERKQA